MKHRSFTIIETLAVIGIVGILSAISFTTYQGARLRTRDAVRKTNLQSIKTAMAQYHATNTSGYPSFAAGGVTAYAECNTSATNWSSLQLQLQPFLAQLPTDPKGACSGTNPWTASATGSYYMYEIDDSSNPKYQQYSFWAALENQNDADRNGGDKTTQGRYKNLFRDTAIWNTYVAGPNNQNYPSTYGVGCRVVGAQCLDN